MLLMCVPLDLNCILEISGKLHLPAEALCYYDMGMSLIIRFYNR